MNQNERYISVEQSIINSCREVNLMRQGKIAKRDWRDVFSELKSELADEFNDEKNFNSSLSAKSKKFA